MIIEQVATAIQHAPLTAAQVCNRVPCVESETRAARILDYLVANGALECYLRGRVRFYCRPGIQVKHEAMPDEKPRHRNVKITAMQQGLLDRIKACPWSATADLVDPDSFRTRLERKRHMRVISGTLLQLWRRELVERIGQKSQYRYAIKE